MKLDSHSFGAYLNYNGSIFAIIKIKAKVIIEIKGFSMNSIIEEYSNTLNYLLKDFPDS